MHGRSVFDHDDVRALWACITKLAYRRGPVRHEPFLVYGIDPGTRYNAGSIMRANFVLVVFNDGVEGGRVYEPFFDQQQLQGFDPQGQIARHIIVIMMVWAVMIRLVMLVHA